MKICIQVDDDELVNSQLLSAKINVSEVGDTSNIYNSFFKKTAVVISQRSVEVSTKLIINSSNAYVYSYFYDWDERTFFEFDCSISFEYNGHFEIGLCSAKRLLSSGKDSHFASFASLLNDDSYADFVFNVRGSQFKVHRCLLSSVSEALKTMFLCGLEETRNNSATIDCKPEVFQYFLAFIYANTVPFEKMPELCIELHDLAHRYGIKRLVMICREYIDRKEIDSSNAMELYELSATHEIETLLETSWEFIKT